MKTVEDLRNIVAADGGLIVDGCRYSAEELRSVAASSKALVIVRNANSKSAAELRSIAASGSGNIIFDLTD